MTDCWEDRGLLEALGSQLEGVVLRSWDNAVATRVVYKTPRIQRW
jgi:hypothetical protein